MEMDDFLKRETAHLIAPWMALHMGSATQITSACSHHHRLRTFWLHGVLRPNFVPNTSDDEGRYGIGAQADVGLFNLEKLLESLQPTLSPSQQQRAAAVLKG
ncbi:unnamed protein product [Gadus morhua 'NCC']